MLVSPLNKFPITNFDNNVLLLNSKIDLVPNILLGSSRGLETGPTGPTLNNVENPEYI